MYYNALEATEVENLILSGVSINLKVHPTPLDALVETIEEIRIGNRADYNKTTKMNLPSNSHWWLFGNRSIIDSNGVDMQVSVVSDKDHRSVLEQGKTTFSVVKDYTNHRLMNIKYPQVQRYDLSIRKFIVPRSTDTCRHCGKGWTIDNFEDIHQPRESFSLDEEKYYHSECWVKKLTDDLEKEVKGIVEELGIIVAPNVYASVVVPNHSEIRNHRGDWLLVATPKGFLVVGYRSSELVTKFAKLTVDYEKLIFDTDGDELHAYGPARLRENIEKLYFPERFIVDMT